VSAALAQAVADGDTGYASQTRPVAEAFAGFADQRWGWTVDPAAVAPVADVAVGAIALLRILTRPGDAVVINPPIYPPFFEWVRTVGASLLEVPLTDGRLDLAEIEAAYAAGASVHVLCNPHNPVGRVHTPEELAALADLAARYDVRVVADEIHAPLVLPGATFTPFLTVPGGAEVGVSLVAASKAWNLAGLKCGLAVAASARMRAVVDALPADAHWHIGHFGALATEAAFRDGTGWLDDLLASLADRRDLLGSLIADRLPGVGWTPPAATYLAWLDCRGLGLDEDPAAAFLRAGVALESGLRFGRVGEGFVRINFGTSRDVLSEAVGRMASALR
jgi:cystathionine beta-lyase